MAATAATKSKTLNLYPDRAVVAEAVVFLGAGASAADGAPIQTQLLRGFFQSKPTAGRNAHAEHVQKELADYFKGMWGIDVINDDLKIAPFPTFEEALGILELGEARGEFFKGFGGRDPGSTRARDLRAHLLSLIAIYLEEKLRRSDHHHRELVQALHTSGELKKTAFVSLNYDILIDNAILMHGATGLDYGFKFSTGFPTIRDTAVQLLKLHGSLNWLYCPTCGTMDGFPGEKIVSHLCDDGHMALCGRCGHPRVPILIPPTFFKVMSNFYLQRIWQRAEEVLRGAKRIIFCGYSFPDADLHIKYLMKRAEVNRHGTAPRVFILNEHPGKNVEARKMEKDRYVRFFREKREVIWVNAGFQDFAVDPHVIDDKARWERLG